VGRVVFAEGDIQGAPYGVSLETPLRAVVGRARSTVATLAAVSVLLVLVGAGISWIISRRVTAPLVTLTTAAEAIARGDYGRPTPASERQDEIGRLAASFDQMAHDVAASRRELERRILDAEVARKEAERASRAKSDFLAVMSHELRTPLNAIAGYTQLLELGVYGDLTDAQRNALTRIARSQTHLLTLINDVLNFAKIDAGQMHYDIAAVSLHYVLDGLEAFIAPQLQAKQLTFTQTPCSPALTVRGDAEKLRQIVLNLLTNAIKFTPAGGVVALECEATGTVAHVRVRDSGVGIPADRIEAIFEPFVQGERALNKPNEGVGLGLAIARDLARGMGGSLAAESAVGEGSVFTLTLPLVTPTAALPREHQNSADQERVKAGTE
jgi:signal transduction histidine kinase